MLQKDVIKMFCLPPAGCSANVYFAWKKILAPDIQVIALEYPGHGTKLKQDLIHDVDEMAQHLAEEIASQLETAEPYILFGHSLGAALIWQVQQCLQQLNLTIQLKLMVVSSRPEQAYLQHIVGKHLLDDDAFITTLKQYNHIPEQLLNHPDMLRFFLKIIRHDFALSDQLLQRKMIKTEIPLLCVYADQDPDIPNAACMLAWQQYSTHWQGLMKLSGDHFYFSDPTVRDQMLAHIRSCVGKLMRI